jgi:hypothetical protein
MKSFLVGVLMVAIGRALVVQEPTTTAHIMGRISTVCLSAQPQPTVVKGGCVDRHPVALVRPTVAIGVAANVLGLVLAINGRASLAAAYVSIVGAMACPCPALRAASS